MYRTLSISTDTEMTIETQEWGEGGTACFFIHGLAEGSYIWSDFAKILSNKHKVYAVDLRGHGNSDWHYNKNYSTAAHIDDICRVLDALQLRQFVLIGHSLGGDVAARVAALRPAGILGVMLVDTGPGLAPDVNPLLQMMIQDSCRPYRSVEDYAAELAETRLPMPAERRLRLAEAALAPASGGGFRLKFDPEVAGILSEELDQSWWEPTLRALAMPVTVVRGALSGILSQQAAEGMVRRLARGRLAVVSQAGHAVMQDNPRDFLEVLQRFIDEAGAGARRPDDGAARSSP
jgi:pimeloyl-ACP methyl ester carboxylesterase